MKLIFTIAILTALTNLVYAQKEDFESKDNLKYNLDELLFPLANDSSKLEVNSKLRANENKYPMIIHRPDLNTVRPMPEMEIDTTTHFTMQIKKYKLDMASPNEMKKTPPQSDHRLIYPKPDKNKPNIDK